MTRIVAGTVGGRRIEVPRSGTRPTSERVREALFARLDHYGVLDGARVLDLCAGSGALGLEAASRGAGDVTLVDSSRAATDTCRRTIRALGLNEVTAVTAKAATFLTGAAGAPVDLVLIDPPYDLTQEELAQLVGASRETVNKSLAEFVSRGWIRLEGRAVTLLDVDRLRRRAR